MARLIPCVFVPLLALLAAVSAKPPPATIRWPAFDAAIEARASSGMHPGWRSPSSRTIRSCMRGLRHEALGSERSRSMRTPLFTLASTSKAFTAMALGIAGRGRQAQLGRSRRCSHIPEFRVADPYVTREVTVRDLLVHRTGIEEMDILWVRGFDSDQASNRCSNAQQASSLRSTWAYNNTMYMVAAEVVARVAGMTFQEFVTGASSRRSA